ncbi:MAG: SDR family NAD(P)-dependent oxidoreductase, partial [Woeseiaceae bacterium]
MDDAKRLFGLKAIVTGASNGIGEAIARTFVKHGAKVLSVDAPDTGIETKFSAVRGISGFAADLVRADATRQIMETASSRLGGLDIVVNNYVIQSDSPITDADESVLEGLLKRKMKVMSDICEAAVPLLKKSPAGRIINVGFVRSSFARDGNGAYASSQNALAEFTKTLAAACGEFGITANYIQPGAIMTPDSRDIFNKDTALRDYCINRSAAKRLGEPVDVAKVALFLATDDSVFVSGTGIVVDGGEANASG